MKKKEIVIIIRNTIFTDRKGNCWKIPYQKDCDVTEFFINIEEQLAK